MNAENRGMMTRRSFVKRSAFTVGAITVMSRGIGLAQDESSAPTDIIWAKFNYTGPPVTITGTGSSYDAAKADFSDKARAAADGNFEKTSDSGQVDVTNYYPLNPPRITETGDQPPSPIEGPPGTWTYSRTLTTGMGYTEYYYE